MHHPLLFNRTIKVTISRYSLFHMKKIIIFAICFALVLIPFTSAYAIPLAAASGAGLSLAVGQSIGLAGSFSGFDSTSSTWIGFENDIINPDGSININYKYSPSSGTVTVTATDYNAILENLAYQWNGNNVSWSPSQLNKPAIIYSRYEAVQSGYPYANIEYRNGIPFGMSWPYEGTSTNVTNTLRMYFTLPAGSSISWSSIWASVPYPYASVDGLDLYDSVTNQRLRSFGIGAASYSTTVERELYFQAPVSLRRNSSNPIFSNLGTVQFSNITPLFNLTVTGWTPVGSTSGIFTIPDFEEVVDNVTTTVSGAAAIVAQKIPDPDGKLVVLTPKYEDNTNVLVSVPAPDVESVLTDAFFDGVSSVVSQVVTGVLEGTGESDEDNSDMIFGEVSWIRQILQKIDTTLDSIKTAVVSLVSGNGDSPPPAIMQPPEWLGGGDGGLGAHIGGIWHYVLSWVGSMASGLALIASVWSGLPPAMTAAIWGSAVVVIVVGLFKRYVA